MQTMRMENFLRTGLMATVIFVVAFVVFCPRFYLWDVNGGPYFAETNRAFFAFIQLYVGPFVNIPDAGNEVLEWRLLFPVVGHGLRLHWMVYFALPHVCAWVLLWAVAAWVLGRTQSWLAAAVATGLTATSAVYFVSTGFLGYFDSALALALGVAALARRNVVVWAAASLGPWIDERFVFALPVVWWCQWRQAVDGRAALLKMVPLALGVAPYLLLRGYALWCDTDFTRSFFHDMATEFVHAPSRLVEAVWDTFRWGWVPLVAAVALTPGVKRLWALTVIPMGMTYLLLCAGDYPRSMGVLLPLVVLGVEGLAGLKAKKWKIVLLVALVLNFATPAYHSFRAFRWRINPLAEQLKMYKMLYP